MFLPLFSSFIGTFTAFKQANQESDSWKKNGITKNRARYILLGFTVVSHIRVPHQDLPWRSNEKSPSGSREPDVCKILPCKCHVIKCASFFQDLHPGTLWYCSFKTFVILKPCDVSTSGWLETGLMTSPRCIPTSPTWLLGQPPAPLGPNSETAQQNVWLDCNYWWSFLENIM